ncbi:hypothetical protein ACIQPR_46135 [Streptomyces sp. NPDC091280]|uniref:hypothetical protein n=1 Tax=Streptomyces sp. NPDC091280 TaxID=3365984 RepID=UPI0038115E07
MRAPKRSTSAVVTVAALAATTAALTAAPASAADYHCTTSRASVDNPAYSGPLSDNINFTAKLCAKRVSGVISAYASISWDGPVWYVNQTGVFDGARVHLQIKKSVPGPDPVVKSANHYGIEYALEHGNTLGNGSFRTPTLTYRAKSDRYLGDGSIQLDWNNDGKSYRTTLLSASPSV